MPDQPNTTEQARKFLLQVQKKTGGPWTEIAAGSAPLEALGAAMLTARAALAFRVLEVVQQVSR